LATLSRTRALVSIFDDPVKTLVSFSRIRCQPRKHDTALPPKRNRHPAGIQKNGPLVSQHILFKLPRPTGSRSNQIAHKHALIDVNRESDKGRLQVGARFENRKTPLHKNAKRSNTEDQKSTALELQTTHSLLQLPALPQVKGLRYPYNIPKSTPDRAISARRALKRSNTPKTRADRAS